MAADRGDPSVERGGCHDLLIEQNVKLAEAVANEINIMVKGRIDP